MRTLSLLGAWLLLAIPIFAQNTLAGRVYELETKEALAGVSVFIPGTQVGATTDNSGEFRLESPAPIDSIVLTLPGYQTRRMAAKSSQTLAIALEPSTTCMQDVVISASREAQNRSEAPVSIGNVSSTMIQDAKPNSIDQVLNKVSGVYMVNLGNEQHSMAIRQPLSYKSLFLYLEDGVPIRTSGLFNHNALIEINMATVKNIEVIRGPASSLYGQEAIGGAVNFITYKPSIVPTAKISLQANNLGYKRVDFQASNTFKKLGVGVAGYYAMRENGLMEHSDFRKLGLSLRADYKFDERTVLHNSVSFIDYNSDMTGSLDSVKFSENNYSNWHTFTYRDVMALRAKSSLSRFWNAKSKTTFTALYRNNSIKQNPSYFVKDDYIPWLGTGDPLLAHGEENDVFFQSYAGIVQHKQSFGWKKAALILGATVDYSPSGYTADYIRIAKTPDGHYSSYERTDSTLSDYTVGVMNYAAYTQFEFSPIPHLGFVAALRYDHFSYDFDNALPPSSYSGSPDSKDVFDAFSPKVGLTYDFQGKSGLYANYSQGFVPPQITELYRGVQVPVLKPSMFYNYELGGWATLVQGKIYLDASLYQLDGVDEIISVRLDNGTYENQNAGKTRHRGVEYGLTANPVKDLQVRLSATNATHRYIEFVERGSDYSGKDMANAPGFIANAEIMYKPRFFKGFRIGAEVQHMSPYFMDPQNTVRYPGFDIFNLRAGYEWKGIELWLNWYNITGEHYATIASKSQWGYSYQLGDPSHLNIGLGYKFAGKQK